MLKSLKIVSELSYANADLIHDLRYVISNISQDRFVQAILSAEPLKPRFQKQTNRKFLTGDVANVSSFVSDKVICSKNGKTIRKTKLQKDESIIERGSIVLMKKHNSISKGTTKPCSSKNIFNHNSTLDSSTCTKPIKNE
jgi:hypothetical protein